MDNIESAAADFAVILSEIAEYQDTIVTEQDARFKVIDRILVEVLGWPRNEVATEDRAGTGFVDYKLTIGGFARAIVEAKREARAFGLGGRNTGQAYKLDGVVFRDESIREGIEQGIRYCGQKNAELACVTNGSEWVVFRGSRLGDGRDSMEGMAFIFTSLGAIANEFKRFYDLMSYAAVREFRFRAHFQEAEGRPIRPVVFRRALRDVESQRLLAGTPLAADLDRVMTSFFRRLSGDDDPDLLAKCFVQTRESVDADRRLARISEDLAGRIRSLDTGSAEELTALVERARATQRNEFVLLVGTKGAGKTTFVDRFFKFVLPGELVGQCVIARVNVADSEGDEDGIVNWLDQHLLETLERAVFQDAPPTFEELQGMFFDEYRRWSEGSLRHLYERDKESFKIEFGRHIEKRREERPHEYIRRLVGNVVRVRRKVPCIVLDNADHFTIDFQEKVFQYGRSVYEESMCLVIMPITDRTSWQLSRQGALKSFENESLFLPTPAPKIILKKRIEYVQERVAEEKREPGRGYFFGRGIGLKIEDLNAFTAALQAVFLKSGEVAYWIGNLANMDVRQSLEIARQLVASPHLHTEELLKTYVAKESVYVAPWRLRQALLRLKYDIYPSQHPFIRNVFALENDLESTPLLPVRLLQLLRDAHRTDPNNPFVSVDQAVEYCRAMQIDPADTMRTLRKLLESALCLSYDPTVTQIEQAGRIELSQSGYQHLRWARREKDYVMTMREVTPIVDHATYDRLVQLGRQPRKEVWREELGTFLDYLCNEDERWCMVPDHAAYASQRVLVSEFQRVLPGEGIDTVWEGEL